MAIKSFVKRVSTFFATNASFLRVIANLQMQLRTICISYYVLVHFLLKKHWFRPKRKTLFCPKISKKCVNCDKS